MKKLTKKDKLKELDKLKKQTAKITKRVNMPRKKVDGASNSKMIQCLICKGFFPKQDCVTVRNKGKIEGYFCSECMKKVKQGVFPQPSPIMPTIPSPIPQPYDPNIEPIPWEPNTTPFEPWTDPNIKWETKYDINAMRTLVSNNKGDTFTIDDLELISKLK